MKNNPLHKECNQAYSCSCSQSNFSLLRSH